MNYSMMELVWLLLIYSFLGWVVETIVGTVKKKKFVNRGFSTGPFCLVYGIAAVFMAVTMEELMAEPVFQLIGCGVLATIIEWMAGKILERLNQHKWWDYSNKKWNFDGYICLQYSVLWAVLGFVAVRYGDAFFLIVYHMIPTLIREILLWILLAGMALDISASLAAVFHIRKEMPTAIRWNKKVAVWTQKFALMIVGHVEKRMAKAYPVIMEKTEQIEKEGNFAEGCGFYKLFWLFLIGAVLLLAGMMFFTLGAELAMTPIGERMGAGLTRSRKLWLVIGGSFLLGAIITISEPDLQVLAEQVPSVPNRVLILVIACGVGMFLVAAVLRMLFGIPLSKMLVVCYLAVFAVACFVPKDFLAVAFDAGGVTTGPMTVPFIMALGVGISAIRNDKHAENDSFGLVALCSIGPVLAVLLLGLVYPAQGSYVAADVPEAFNSVELGRLFLSEIPYYLKEIAGSLLPIVFFFGIFQLVSIQLHKKTLIKICVGLLYTYVGLVLFLTGANVGFIPAGNYLGTVMASLPCPWILVPVGMVIGYFIVKAEPAVYVLMKQVEELTDGDISGKAMQISLSVGVAASVGLSMLRVLTGIPIMYFLIPGYAIALFLTLFVPKIFTAIAFDSGGVASGPMTATFLLPLAQGACTAVGGDVVKDAFGVVAMVAMTPLITLQVLGLIYKIKSNKKEEMAEQPFLQAEDVFAGYADDAIIEL